MRPNAASLRGSLVRFSVGAGLLLAAGLGLWAARVWPQAVSAWFLPWSRWICGVLAAVTGWVPLSVAELLIYLLTGAALATLVVTVVRGIHLGAAARRLLRWTAHWFLAAGCIAFLFVWSWGLSYEAPALSARLGYSEPDRSPQALFDVCMALGAELNTLADQVPRDASGGAAFGSFQHQAHAVSQAAARFFDRQSVLRGSTVPVKPVLASGYLSDSGITGIYICLTGESNVNTETPHSVLPFTMAHEMAHRAAVAPEEEANFAAFLICRESEEAFVRYSGCYQTLIYCYNALARVSPTLQLEVYRSLDDRVLCDFRIQAAWSDAHNGPQREQAEQRNDAYLKTMNQSAGIASYGQVVDLVLAWHQSR